MFKTLNEYTMNKLLRGMADDCLPYTIFASPC